MLNKTKLLLTNRAQGNGGVWGEGKTAGDAGREGRGQGRGGGKVVCDASEGALGRSGGAWESSGELCIYKNARLTAIAAIMLVPLSSLLRYDNTINEHEIQLPSGGRSTLVEPGFVTFAADPGYSCLIIWSYDHMII